MDSVALDLGKKTLSRNQTIHVARNFRTDGFLITVMGCFFIAIVSAYDTYLVTIEENILFMEKNPICVLLIKLDPNGFSYFIMGKATGTVVVISSILFFHCKRYSYAWMVTRAIVAFQAMLLIYLHFSDPLLGGLPNFALLFTG